MKYIIIFLFYSLLAGASFARPASYIQGKSATKGSGEVILFSYKDGMQERITSVKYKADGTFKLVFTPRYEGFYLLGKSEKNWYPIYLKGGEQVNINILGNKANLYGENTPENKALYQWEERAAQVRLNSFLYEHIRGEKSIGYQDFFRQLDCLAKEKETLMKKVDTPNTRFNKLLIEKIGYDLNFYALVYLQSHGNKIPDTVIYPEYYSNMQPELLFQDPRILSIPCAADMLDTYVWYAHKSGMITENNLKQNVAYFHNKRLQQEYLLSQAVKFKYYDQYQKMLDDFKGGIITNSIQKRLDVITRKLNWSKPGTQAPDFEGISPTDKKIAFSDFKGKVVVVDVWATWCDPCLKMMPYFQKLEQEKESPEVAFISVCMGANVEKKAWLRIIQQNQLEGNLIFIGSWTDGFAQDYKITGVPRFMVFNRKGQIISIAAPSPTSPELKKMIEKELKKK